MKIGNLIDVPALATPAGSPIAGRVSMYVKTDGAVYTKDSSGTERSWFDITDGSVTSAKLAAGSVTASKLTVASAGESIILNGSFRDVDATGKPEGWATNDGTYFPVATQSNGVTRYLKIAMPGGSTWAAIYQNGASGAIPCSPGDQFYVEAGFSSTSVPFTAGWIMYENNADGTLITTKTATFAVTADSSTTAPQRASAVLTAGSTTAVVRFGVYVPVLPVGAVTLYVSDYIVRRVIVSAMIADNAISTTKLVDSAVTTAKIAAANVTGDKLATTLTGAHTFSSTLTGTASIVASSATDSSFQISRIGGLVTEWNYVPWYAGATRTGYIGTAAGVGDFVIVSETAGAAVRLQPLAGPMLSMGPTAALLTNRTTVGNIALIVRGMVGQTGDYQSWQNSAGTALASVAASGAIVSQGFLGPYLQALSATGPYLDLSSSAMTIINRTSTVNVPLTIRGYGAQSGDLQQWQDSSAVVKASVRYDGYLQSPGLQNLAQTGAYISTAGNQMTVIGRTDNGQLIVKGNSTQTASLQEWQNSAGTSLASVSSIGTVFGANLYTAGVAYAPSLQAPAATGPYLSLTTLTAKIENRTTVGNIPLTIKGMVGQTGDLQQWQDSASVVRASIPSGSAVTPKTVVVSEYLLSRAQNLVSNGSAYLGNNTNFSMLTYDGSDTPGGGGGFATPLSSPTIFTDEFIPVDPAMSYTLTAWAREKTPGLASRLYIGIVQYDIDDYQISPSHVMWSASTNTTLAVQLNPGDPTITLTSASGWNNAAGANTYYRSLISWNYVNSRGYAWPVRTYSRLSYPNIYDDGAISGNVITLRVPWAGPMIPAGTAVNNASSGGTYKYIAAANNIPGNTWTRYSGSIGGIDLTGAAIGTQFSPGTASVKILILPNRSDAGPYLATANQVYANFWFSEMHGANIAPLTITGDKLATSLIGAHTFTSTATGMIPLAAKGFAGQNGNLTEWQDSTGAILANVSAAGTITAGGGGIWAYSLRVPTNTGPYMDITTAGMVAENRTSTSNVLLRIRGMAAQSGNLQEWQDSAATVLSRVTSTGRFRSDVVGLGISTGGLTDVEFDYSGVQGAFQWSSSLGRLTIKAVNTGAIPLVVKAVAAQTGNLQEWQDSAAAILTRISSNGTLVTPAVLTSDVWASTATGPYLTLASTGMNLYNRTDAANVLLTLRGMAAQTGNYFVIRDSANVIVSYVNAGGDFYALGHGMFGYARANSYQAVAATGPYIETDGTDVTVLNRTTVGNVPLVVQGMAGQTGDHQQWKNSAGTVLSAIGPNGYVRTNLIDSTGSNSAYIGLTGNSGIAITPRYDAIQLIVKAHSTQTANIQEWRDYGNTVTLASVSAAGSIRSSSFEWTPATGPYLNMGGTAVVVQNRTTASNIPLIIKGMAAQTGNLMQWQDSAAAVLGYVSSGGTISGVNLVGTTRLMSPAWQGVNLTGPYMTMDETNVMVLNRTTTSLVPLIVKGMAGQTGNLTEWRDSANGLLASMSSTGVLLIATAGLAFMTGSKIVGGGGAGEISIDPLGTSALRVRNDGISLAQPIRSIGFNPAAVALTVKGEAAQTANLQEWQDSAGTAMTRINETGAIGAPSINRNSFAGPWITFGSTAITLENRTAISNVPLIVKGMAAQSGNLQEWQDSAGAIKASVNYIGSMQVAHLVTSATGTIVSNFAGTAPYIQMGAASITVTNRDAIANIPLIVKGMAGQTGDLQQWHSSAGASLARIDQYGEICAPLMQTAAGTGPYISLSGTNVQIVNRTTVGNIPFSVKGMAAQTGDLQQWMDSTSAVKAWITAAGAFYTESGIVQLYGGVAGAQAAVFTPPAGGTIAIVARGRSGQTGDLQQWQDNTSAVLAKVTSGGVFSGAELRAPYVQNTSVTGTYFQFVNGSIMAINRDAIANVPLAIKGMAAQTGDLQQWQDSAGAVVARVGSAGVASLPHLALTGPSGSITSNNAGSDPYIQVGTTQISVRNRTAVDNVPFMIRGMASQTGDLQQWQDSAAAVVAKVTSAGYIYEGANRVYSAGNPPPVGEVSSVAGRSGDVVLTSTDVGLANVDNTTDAAKPVSTAGQTALNLKANIASPTFTGTVAGITSTMVGLGSVNNTADTAKPVSTAQQTALDLKANLASPTFTGTVAGITSTMVGLGSVNNTADSAKPVSTAQQTALDLKANLASPTFTGTVSAPTIQESTATGPYLTLSTASTTILNRTTVGNIPLVVKGMASQSGDLQQWQDSAATVLTRIRSDGVFTTSVGFLTGNVQHTAGTGPYISLATTAVTVLNRTTVGNVPLIVKGMAAQSGDLTNWQDSTGANVARVSSAGAFIAIGQGFYGTFLQQTTSATGPWISMTSTQVLLANRTTVGNVPLAVRGMAAQTGDLQRWQDSALATLGAITATGSLLIANVEALAGTGAYINFSGSGGVDITGRSDNPQLLVRSHSSQTAPIQVWATSIGGSLASVEASGQINTPAVKALGLTGAVAGSRYAGAISTGNTPTTGTFALGDIVVDSGNATLAVCSVAGSPGTWTSMPRGLVGSAKVTTQQGPTSGTTLLTVATVTVPFVNGRNYRITCSYHGITPTVATDRFSVGALVNSVSIFGVTMIPGTTINDGNSVVLLYTAAATASYAVDMYLARGTGTGTATMYGGATAPITLMVEDIGVTV